MVLIGMLLYSILVYISINLSTIHASPQGDSEATAIDNLSNDVVSTFEADLSQSGASPNISVPISMEILHIDQPPGIGNAVKLNWGAPPKFNFTYWVYYGKDDEELTDPKLTTNDVSVIIENLEFCTKYKFAISVANGVNKINPNNVRSIVTYLDRLAPPENLLVEYEPREVPCLLIKWSASCTNIGQPIGYVISIFQYRTSSYAILTMPANKLVDNVYRFKATYGEKFDIKVSTNFPGSQATDTITYKVPNFLQPYKVRVTSNPDGAFMIYWSEPFLPYYIDRVYYEVYIYRGTNISGNYEKYYVTRPVLIYKGNESEYTFSVGLVSYDGQSRSLLTDPIVANLNGEVREINIS